MTSGMNNCYSNWTNPRGYLLVLVFFLSLLFAGNAWGQVGGSITGKVKDPSGAAVAGATVIVKNTETGLTRTAETNENGDYLVLPLPVGQYELSAEKPGFKQALQKGITLVVAQQAVVNLTLEVGNIEQQVTVEAEGLIVNTTLAPTSGLVSETQLKDLPLNGRSWDQLLTLNPGVINYNATANASAATTASNLFTVSGRRYEENRFLMNGIEYVGSDMQGSDPQPFGSSGKLLGVDAIREFNVITDTYGAEYGKRAGGQVLIVTTAGTNQLHGDVFEFVRNSIFDARNNFDVTSAAPPFKRNQFGGALGGPLKKDKIFLFGNYEGFRQRLGVSANPGVPDAQARLGFLPDPCSGIEKKVSGFNAAMTQIMNAYWVPPSGQERMVPTASTCPAGSPASVPSGISTAPSNPSQAIQEDFGLTRFDYTLSAKDTFDANFLIDDGVSIQPGRNPVSEALIPQKAQLISLQETHIFSSNLVNVVNAGFSRAWQTQTNVPVAGSNFTPASNFVVGGSFGSTGSPGKITVGPSTSVNMSTNPVTGTIVAGATHQVRNYFSGSDDLHFIRGSHSMSFGVWFQDVQNNYNGGSAGGSVAYPDLPSLLADKPRFFQITPHPTAQGARIKMGAWYVEDEIRLKSNLTLRLGLRDELTSGFHEQNGRFSNYYMVNGVVQTIPFISDSALLSNNAKSLWQPRVGLAWDPTGKGTWSVRTGAGIYYDLQDSILQTVATSWPFSGRMRISKTPLLSLIPFNIDTAPPNAPPCTATGVPTGCATYALGGIDPYMHSPVVQEWSLTLEHQITKDFGVRLGYVGSQQYHGSIAVNLNTIPSQVCTASAGCPAGGINTPRPGGLGTSTAPQGTLYVPVGPLPNPFIGSGSQQMYEANSSYHGLTASVVKRSDHGLTFRANYTYSKVLNTSGSGGVNEPTDTLDAYNLNLSKGPAGFDVRHQFSGNFTYELPFGKNKRWGSGATGFTEKLIGGWQWNGILTAQTGFPFTPQAGDNYSGNGDTGANPDVVSFNPNPKVPEYAHTSDQWYNANFFTIPAPGTFGNVARGSLVGPGLLEVDTSLFKHFSITERTNLEFRSEFFNIINRANLGMPNPTVFSGGAINGQAGFIQATATTSRQIQFAMKLNF